MNGFAAASLLLELPLPELPDALNRSKFEKKNKTKNNVNISL